MSSGTAESKVLLFSGKAEDWGIWSKKFRSSLVKDKTEFVLNLASLATNADRQLGAQQRLKVCANDDEKYADLQHKVHAALTLATIDTCFTIASAVESSDPDC